MEESEKQENHIGRKVGGLVVGYIFICLATLQLIFISSADIVSIFCVLLLSFSVRWNCGIISKTPEFLWALLWLMKFILTLSGALCFTMIVMEVFILASYALNVDTGYADYADTAALLNVLIFVFPTTVLLWFLSSYMDSVFESVKVAAALNGHIIETHWKRAHDCLEKLKDLYGKMLVKSSEILESPFNKWQKHPQDKTADIENSKFLNGDFFEVIVVPDPNNKCIQSSK